MNNWSDILSSKPKAILDWAAVQSWTRPMAECAQDKIWHAEGDVWTHTKMVIKSLQGLAEWDSLSNVEQKILLFTALFHDAGKPATSIVDEQGHIRSPRHALVGSQMAREVLRELSCPLETREQICNLVRYHGRPTYLLEKEKAELEVISTSWRVSNRLLYLFALADTRGRKTIENARLEEQLQLWQMLSQERDCYDKPYLFAKDHARFLFFREELSSLHYVPFEKFRCNVIMMSGLPGAGKDTWINSQRPNLPVVSLDAIREELDISAEEGQGKVVQEAREQCRVHLRAGTDFIFNATNVSLSTRKRWVDLFNDYNARIEIIYLEPPLAQIYQQNRERLNPVPANIIENLIKRLDVPAWTECHRLRLLQNAFEREA